MNSLLLQPTLKMLRLCFLFNSPLKIQLPLIGSPPCIIQICVILFSLTENIMECSHTLS